MGLVKPIVHLNVICNAAGYVLKFAYALNNTAKVHFKTLILICSYVQYKKHWTLFSILRQYGIHVTWSNTKNDNCCGV